MHASLWPVHFWFLNITFVCSITMCVFVWYVLCVCACVRACMHACVCAPNLKAINNQWYLWTPYDWLNKFYSFYIAAVAGDISRCSLSIDTYSENQPNKHNIILYIHFNSCSKWQYIRIVNYLFPILVRS